MTKIERFAKVVESEQIESRVKHDLACEANIIHCKTHIVAGKKYTKVDVGDSGKYMVVNDTGEIYGIKAYGVIHKGHYYGTLDTIDNYFWGDYYPVRLKQPKEQKELMTAESFIESRNNQAPTNIINFFDYKLKKAASV